MLQHSVEISRPGELLTTVRFVSERPLFSLGTDALYIFEHCLVYSRSRRRSVEWAALSFPEQFSPELQTGAAWVLYDAQLALDATRDVDDLLAAHPHNWIVWSRDVVAWDLRPGIRSSRLRVEVADGTRRKVRWGRATASLPPIRAALERSQGPARSRLEGFNLEVCYELAEALDAHEVPEDLLSPDFRLHDTVSDKTYVGAAGLHEWLADLLDGVGGCARCGIEEVIAVGEDFAVGSVALVGQAQSGAPLQLRSIAVCWFDAEKVTMAAGYASRHLALKAVGLAG